MKSFRIQLLFENVEQLRVYCDKGQHIRWGYDTVEDLWNANPVVEWIDFA